MLLTRWWYPNCNDLTQSQQQLQPWQLAPRLLQQQVCSSYGRCLTLQVVRGYCGPGLTVLCSHTHRNSSDSGSGPRRPAYLQQHLPLGWCLHI